MSGGGGKRQHTRGGVELKRVRIRIHFANVLHKQAGPPRGQRVTTTPACRSHKCQMWTKIFLLYT